MAQPRHRTRWGIGVLTALLLTACRDEFPTAPQPPEAVIGVDEAVTIKVPSNRKPLTLAWLAPLGTASGSAPHDRTLRPVVTICRWNKDRCVGIPVAVFVAGLNLKVSATAFTAEWDISHRLMPAKRTTYRITASDPLKRVGAPVFVDVSRGRWALSLPGQSPPLVPAKSISLQFRLGEQTVPPPPLNTVVAGLTAASTQFLPKLADGTRTPEQTGAINTLTTSLAELRTALTGPTEQALLTFSQAKRAADNAFTIAVPGDRAELDVIRLELAQVGLLLGSGG